jgi:peptidyl-prolyl cis-trans isomerase C
MRDRLWSWLREPLVQFLLGGLAIFVFASWRGEAVDPASRTITLNEAQIGRLAANFSQSWMRQPSPTEIDGLIRDYIKEEIYYREAIRMGLDADDAIIRRRLRSKMEFLAESQVETERPSDATLQAWLNRSPQRYAAGVRISWQDKGVAITLPRSLERANQEAIRRDFGEEFASALAAQPMAQWNGPISSGFGQHLVRVRAIESSGIPQLSEVRQQVENDWRAATAKAREAKGYQTLLDSYTIKIAKP